MNALETAIGPSKTTVSSGPILFENVRLGDAGDVSVVDMLILKCEMVALKALP